MKWLRLISLCILLAAACRPAQIAKMDAAHIGVKSDTGIDSGMYYMLQEYKVLLDEKMNRIISYAPEDLVRDQPSSNLGNMMADIIYNFYLQKGDTIDMAIMNQGGIRVPSIAKGPLSVRDAYQLMPFDNEIVQLKIPGTTLQTLLQHACNQKGWPVSHTEIEVDSSMQIQRIYINGQLLDLNKTYTIATNDYIANGGDKCSFLTEYPMNKSGKLLRDAIIESWSAEKEGITIDNHERTRYGK